MIKYDDVKVILDTEAWEDFKTSAAASVPEDDLTDFLFKSIKEQLCCLRYRAGVRFGRLPRLSTGGKPYDFDHVKRAYEILLAKFTAGTFDPKPVVRGMEEVLIKAATAFRGGTMTAKAKQDVEDLKQKYRQEITECRTERDTARVKSRCGLNRRRKKVTRVYADLSGKRVAVPFSYFGVSGDGVWLGLVGSWRKYFGTDLNEYMGYEILYDLGDRYNMIEEDVHSYLVDESDITVCISEKDITDSVECDISSSSDSEVVVTEKDRDQLGLDIYGEDDTI